MSTTMHTIRRYAREGLNKPESRETALALIANLADDAIEHPPEQPAREADDQELRKQALIATAEFIADDRRWQELRDGGAICKSHELAVLVTHINDGEPCSDYLHDAPAARKAGVE